MDNEEIEELFGPLRAAGWNPRMIDSSVVRYDNSVAAGYPTDIGDVLCEDYDAPHGEVNIHTKFQVDVRGDSMIGANIESGDTLTVLAGVKPMDGDIVLAELDREYTVKAYFEDDEGERWLVPFNEDFKPIRLNGGRDIRILGRVIEVVKKSVRRSYRECERIVRRSRAKLAKKSPTREQQENAIRKVGELVKKGRQWYSVYRVLIDAESELVTKGDFDGFCRLVSLLLPGHAHLPVAQELQRMAVMSFDKPVRLWDENNAPVSRGRFKDYKRIADQMGELLKVA
jgi:hypothetical protein